MKQLEISDYRKVNESCHRRLVYHLGIDCGFFVELNYMVNAMLYCLANGYRFQLYSEDANFGTYGEYVRLSQDVAHEPDKFYHIPALGISCSYTEAYAMLARIIWQPQPEVQQKMKDARHRLSLPEIYSGIQIWEGNNATGSRLISGWQIIQALHPQDGECIFALADNYQQLEIVRNEFQKLRIVSLCQPHETGYHHQAFEHLSPQEKKESIIRLLISVDILLQCCAFVGTITSGPSVFLLKVRADDPCVTAIDCPQDMLPDCLTLNIDERAAISRRFVLRLI